MASKHHTCGKRLTQVHRMGKFEGLYCTKCKIFLPKTEKRVNKW